MVTMTCDPSCYSLAEHFLQDEPSVRGDRELFTMCCNDLAWEIQDAIENWLFVRMPAEHALDKDASK
jgi:hypothetical protein